MKLIYDIENFDMEQIAESGQCFRWFKQEDESFLVLSKDKAAILKKQEGVLSIDTLTEDEEYFEYYLDLKTDYAKFISSVDIEDEYLINAAREGKGIRILHQDLWEMMVTFMISQNNNIPRIKKSVEKICRTYGKQHSCYFETIDQTIEWYTFPTALELKNQDLKDMGLGYRQNYIEELVEKTVSGEIILSHLSSLNSIDAKKELLKIKGIGEKVANCICLFGLHKLDAFPIDTWVKKILAEHYMSGFPVERYDGCAGVMQQYMFYYERVKIRRKML